LKFVFCPIVDAETNRGYLFANGINEIKKHAAQRIDLLLQFYIFRNVGKVSMYKSREISQRSTIQGGMIMTS
jgi:hypothetical protein